MGGAFAGLCLVALTLLVTIHVVMRQLTGSGIAGVDEMSSYLMLGIVYGGVAMALRDGTFIRVDILADRFHGWLELGSALLVRLLALMFVGLLTWRSWELFLASYESGLESIGVLMLDLWIPQSAIAVGCTILSLQVLVSVLLPLESGRDSRPIEAPSAVALATPHAMDREGPTSPLASPTSSAEGR